MKELIFIGAGSGFREVFELVKDINDVEEKYAVKGILDDNSDVQGKTLDGIPVLGTLEDARHYENAEFVFCIGSKDSRKNRKEIFDRLGMERGRFATLVHPSVKVYSTAKIGWGCIVHYGSLVNYGAVVKDFCILGIRSVIGCDTVLEDFSMLATNVTVLNRVHIGEGAFLGTSSTIYDELTIGKYGVVGMGAVLSRNVGEDEFAFGNPARVMKSTEMIGKEKY